MANKIQHLDSDFDARGDYALFIEAKHFKDDSGLDDNTKNQLLNIEATFFRVIENGEQQSGHGWIEDGEIIQWG